MTTEGVRGQGVTRHGHVGLIYPPERCQTRALSVPQEAKVLCGSLRRFGVLDLIRTARPEKTRMARCRSVVDDIKDCSLVVALCRNEMASSLAFMMTMAVREGCCLLPVAPVKEEISDFVIFSILELNARLYRYKDQSQVVRLVEAKLGLHDVGEVPAERDICSPSLLASS